jgi:glycosyltransferase involved in cell wall biosynthesis
MNVMWKAAHAARQCGHAEATPDCSALSAVLLHATTFRRILGSVIGLPKNRAARTPGREPVANLVSFENGGGLTTDIDILWRVLEDSGCRVVLNGRRMRKPRKLVDRVFHGVAMRFRHACSVMTGRPAYDVNLFIEFISPRFIPDARKNWFIPNPEWFREENLPHLTQMDAILCKTRDAVNAFMPLAPDVRYIGFTSPDKLDSKRPRGGDMTFLHSAGASRWKGTSAVITAWSRHPEWPRLIVIRSPSWYDGKSVPEEQQAANIEYLTQRLDDRTWQGYQNSCEVHLCPSEAEGFGHLIVEAMSCGAVVVTTDGPPMNELVTKDRGVLVSHSRSEPMCRGHSFFVDVDDLERQIARVLAMPPYERLALGKNARQWYEDHGKAFEAAMRNLVDEVRRVSGKG